MSPTLRVILLAVLTGPWAWACSGSKSKAAPDMATMHCGDEGEPCCANNMCSKVRDEPGELFCDRVTFPTMPTCEGCGNADREEPCCTSGGACVSADEGHAFCDDKAEDGPTCYSCGTAAAHSCCPSSPRCYEANTKCVMADNESSCDLQQ